MVAQDAEDIEATGSIVWNYYKIDGVQSKRGGAKNVRDSDVDVDQASPDWTGPTGRVPSRPATGVAQVRL